MENETKSKVIKISNEELIADKIETYIQFIKDTTIINSNKLFEISAVMKTVLQSLDIDTIDNQLEKQKFHSIQQFTNRVASKMNMFTLDLSLYVEECIKELEKLK